MSDGASDYAYSARIQPAKLGWSIEILSWPAGAPPWLKTVERPGSWALTHRGALRKTMRILRRRRAAANRELAAMEVDL